MEDLIEALQIFLKYCNDRRPTWCAHEVLMVLVDPWVVSKADTEKLAKLDFYPDDDNTAFISHRFGS